MRRELDCFLDVVKLQVSTSPVVVISERRDGTLTERKIPVVVVRERHSFWPTVEAHSGVDASVIIMDEMGMVVVNRRHDLTVVHVHFGGVGCEHTYAP